MCFKQGDRDQCKDGGALNQYTLSPASESSYHIYEMADMEVLDGSQEPQEAVDKSKNRSGSTSSSQTQGSYIRGSGSYKYKKSAHRQHAPPPRRYNSVSAYEFMRPQLQASAAKMKQTRVPVNTNGVYSEITDEGEPSQQSDTYIFMRPEEPFGDFSSLLSKWFDTDKDTTTEQTTGTTEQTTSTTEQTTGTTEQTTGTTDQTTGTADQGLSQVSEEDVYITML